MVYGITEIMEMLPHRYPFLLVDSITELDKDKKIVGIKNVTINEPFFQGHFPGHPVMPGVLIIEAMAQVGGIFAYATNESLGGDMVTYFVGIDNAKFRKPVVPGDVLRMELEMISCRRGIYTFAGKSYVGSTLVAEAQLKATFAQRGGEEEMIHQTAIIHPNARIAENVAIGAYSLIGEHVSIGAGTWIGPHVVIEGWTEIGQDNKIYQFASIGADPQDLKFNGEQSSLRIGDRNKIREFVTMHRGTEEGGGETIIGSDSLFMAYTHVAHDCRIGNHVILANAATLAGHVEVMDYAILGGLSAAHQFVRIGEHVMASGGSMIAQDLPPYTLAQGDRAKTVGINSLGLKRRGFSEEAIRGIKNAYKLIYRSDLKQDEALQQIIDQYASLPEVMSFVEFIQGSERGLAR